MNSELGRLWMWSESNFRYYPASCLEGLGGTVKTSVRIAGIWAKTCIWLNEMRVLSLSHNVDGGVSVAVRKKNSNIALVHVRA
jgi:hypothetical protein